jgi:serine/threonine protein phosphatase PrpC
LHIKCGAKSDQGMVRDSNEDTYVADDTRKTFLVADGMGGHAAGEIASKLAAEAVEASLAENTSNQKEAALQNAVQEANTRVFETQMQKSELRGMGSTLTVLSFSDSRFHIAHVGDSRAYLFRSDNLRQLTQDHSVVWPLYENGILTKEDISKHPQKNLITRSIGTYPQVEVDLYSDDIHEDDIFLLCTDGLTDVLTDKAIAQILSAKVQDMQEFADHLVDEANTAGGPDNITIVVVRCVL